MGGKRRAREEGRGPKSVPAPPLMPPVIGPSFSLHRYPGKDTAKKLRTLVAPHVESFNYFLDEGLVQAVKDLPKVETQLGEGGPLVRMHIESVKVGYPAKKNDDTVSTKILPRECRERGLTYSAPFLATVVFQIDDGEEQRVQRRFGDCPIMVRSTHCHLNKLTPREMVMNKEETSEMGGYFVVNGIERVIRLLQVPRRNHPQAISRATFVNRGPSYSNKGVVIRCAKQDQSTITCTLHYLTTGGATLRFTVRKQEFLVPVVTVLKALKDISDREIFDRSLQGDDNTFMAARIEVLLRDAKRADQHTREECLAFLGSRFRSVMPGYDGLTDAETGIVVIDRYVLVHLTRHADKQQCLLLMLRKLYTFVQGQCSEDNQDALSNHELLLPGHLLTVYLKEKMEDCLLNIRGALLKDARKNLPQLLADVYDPKFMLKVIDRFGCSVANKIAVFLATGNVTSSTGLDLMQVSGFTIVAERINFLRYMSHFRSVHRGQFFTTMKTTAVRKLLPESWGFLCPVHTPDGGPCGLLNHLAAECRVLCYNSSSPSEHQARDQQQQAKPQGGAAEESEEQQQQHKKKKGGGPLDPSSRSLDEVLVALGVTPASTGGGDGNPMLPTGFLPVTVDGRVVGGGSEATLREVSKALRSLKVQETSAVEPTLEVGLVPPMKGGAGPFPGLFLFTHAARMVRPVLQLGTNRREWVGPMEQVFMEIACLPDDIRPGQTTHRELDPTNMLSLVASLTPFSDYNQSPRNMYQCQMGKQTMGTPAHCITPHRIDNKMYRILFPQAPIVQTRRHSEYQMDDYPQGTNAVVAVISYTGFDMEDAMILNKSSYERGFGHASVLKTMNVNLKSMAGGGGRHPVSAAKLNLRFRNTNKGDENNGAAAKLHDSLEMDGLPAVGNWVNEGDPLYCVVDELTGAVTTGKHKESEKAAVENVRIIGAEGQKEPLSQVSMTLRFPRNPIIGDKFSSRHGQKGVMSILWPSTDMPFTESGMSPDIIINPHAFPSRMTIGMLIESMAGKSGALHGAYQDATPFAFHEQNRIIDHFGEQLSSAGYAYYGSEPLYSGISGTVMHADIFIGLVYYQRLRHMVSDKSQVRATGPVNPVTRQPIKGRKKKGGVRFGEMERDALISHGAAFLLHDRLFNCSDRHVANVCAGCGSLLNPSTRRMVVSTAGQSEAAAAAAASRSKVVCRSCGDEQGQVKAVALPYVFRYLVNELAGMGVKLELKLKSL